MQAPRRRLLAGALMAGLPGLAAAMSSGSGSVGSGSGPGPVGSGSVSSGPVDSGSMTPARRADVGGHDARESGMNVLQETLIFARHDGYRDFRVTVRQPAGPAPAQGWPVLTALDGNAVLAALPPHAALAQQLVLVAVGYDSEARFETASRAWDYTPLPPGAPGPVPDPRAQDRLNGGADAFLDFLQRVQRELSARLPLDPRRRSLFGHSYGGLCVLHALLTRPRDHDRYIAASPSLWWHAPALIERIDTALPRPGDMPPAQLQVLVGGEERLRQQRCTHCDSGVPTQSQAETFVQRIAVRDDVRTQLEILPGLSHGQMLAAALPWALRTAAA